MKSPLAVALGKMAKGKPKNYSAKELARRRRMMEQMNEMRKRNSEWAKAFKAAAKLPRKHKPAAKE